MPSRAIASPRPSRMPSSARSSRLRPSCNARTKFYRSSWSEVVHGLGLEVCPSVHHEQVANRLGRFLGCHLGAASIGDAEVFAISIRPVGLSLGQQVPLALKIHIPGVSCFPIPGIGRASHWDSARAGEIDGTTCPILDAVMARLPRSSVPPFRMVAGWIRRKSNGRRVIRTLDLTLIRGAL